MELTYENLKNTIQQLLTTTGKMIDLGASIKDLPDLRIRYMNTAGGMQLCLKEISWRGESSGMYYSAEEIDKICELTMRLYHRKLESVKDFSSRIKNLSEESKARLTQLTQADWQIVIRDDETYRNLHLEAGVRKWAEELGGDAVTLKI